MVRVIDVSEAQSDGYRLRVYASTPEQLVLCYRELAE